MSRFWVADLTQFLRIYFAGKIELKRAVLLLRMLRCSGSRARIRAEKRLWNAPDEPSELLCNRLLVFLSDL